MYMQNQQKKTMNDLISKLGQQTEFLNSKQCVIGFDACIDEIIHLVRKRVGLDQFERIETIEEFGNRVLSAAGKSSNIEMYRKVLKIGGNGPLMSLAVRGIGPKVTCIGPLGVPQVLPVFKPLENIGARLISTGNPGHTDALEFLDGKIMLGKPEGLNEFNWKAIEKYLGEAKFAELMNQCDLLACTSWTMLIHMPEVLDKILNILNNPKKPIIFFDLADPEKRQKSEIAHLLKQITALNHKGQCLLGLNLREAEQISEVLGIPTQVEDSLEGLKLTAKTLSDALTISGVAIHSIKHAGASFHGNTAAVPGPYCANPSMSTGAGDHFNGGLCSGLLAGLSLEEALYTGVATSGWYVRHTGESPKLSDVMELLEKWEAGELAS